MSDAAGARDHLEAPRVRDRGAIEQEFLSALPWGPSLRFCFGGVVVTVVFLTWDKVVSANIDV